jgi:hypothetical protein
MAMPGFDAGGLGVIRGRATGHLVAVLLAGVADEGKGAQS